MSQLVVGTSINASPARVWASVEDISSHVEWMRDALSIEFHTDQRAGVGTAFTCHTRVAGLETADEMVITEWEPGRRMGVRHRGLITGSGTFLLSDLGNDSTGFLWQESLSFPWRVGGPFTAMPGALVLRAVWQQNLRNLKRLVEAER